MPSKAAGTTTTQKQKPGNPPSKIRHITHSNFGDRLSELRNARELTQVQLGDLIGADYRVIQRLESGRSQAVKIERINDLAKALNVAPADLMAEPGAPIPAGDGRLTRPLKRRQRQLTDKKRRPRPRQRRVNHVPS